MKFEYDIPKSNSNKKKHGIDFIEAKDLWNDGNRIVIPAKSEDEVRYTLIGKLKNKLWSAFYTLRNKKIRLISVRRARKEEKTIYEG